MLDEKWATYAKIWSLSVEERKMALPKLVTDDVTYTDPNTDLSGVDAFQSNMAQLQEDMPGAYFEMLAVKGHHNKTLGQWRLCDKGGEQIMLGTSFATLNDDGKFTSFVGFF